MDTDAPLTVTRRGSGPPVLVLHGGGGPMTVAPIAEHLASSYDVIVPTVPGWNGTVRPQWMTTVDDVALAFLDHLRDEELRDVAVVGSSIGGWIGAAMAVYDGERARLGRLALIDALGVAVPGETLVDFFTLDARGIAQTSFHDPDRFYVDPASLSAEQRATQAANMASLRVIAGDPYMHDPHLLRRLARVTNPVLGLWGDSDGVSPPAYGAAYTAAFPNAEFRTVPAAGHLPQLEQPERTWAVLDPFLRGESLPEPARL